VRREACERHTNNRSTGRVTVALTIEVDPEGYARLRHARCIADTVRRRPRLPRRQARSDTWEHTMGYTHYWSCDPTHPEWQPGFARLVLDTKQIIQAAGVPLCGEFDAPTTPPELAEGWIRFNGVGDDGHEGFLLAASLDLEVAARWKPATSSAGIDAGNVHGGFWWSFCKTARKPYDLVVCAVLLRAHHHMPSCFAIGSDGVWDVEWRYGANYWPGDPESRSDGARVLVARLFGAAQVPDEGPLGPTTSGPLSIRGQDAIRHNPSGG